MAISKSDLDQSHEWDRENLMPDPHSSGWSCPNCFAIICMFCAPEQNSDWDKATKPCPGKEDNAL